ncbi:MAG: galactose-1-epimerase, partial [Flavobacteriales bacterium]|nr:galactose-1-epimerase [Flavobacteriales bacterium]
MKKSIIAVLALLTMFTACSEDKTQKNTEQEKTVQKKEKNNWTMDVNGKEAKLFVLTNKNNMVVTITNFGGKVVTIDVPDRDGKFEDVVLGYDNIEETVKGNLYFGALIGRYGNRIAKGKFTIDGTEYTLKTNNDYNALHGGVVGYNDVVWDAKQDGNKLVLKHIDADMHEGYPV